MDPELFNLFPFLRDTSAYQATLTESPDQAVSSPEQEDPFATLRSILPDFEFEADDETIAGRKATEAEQARLDQLEDEPLLARVTRGLLRAKQTVSTKLGEAVEAQAALSGVGGPQGAPEPAQALNLPGLDEDMSQLGGPQLPVMPDPASVLEPPAPPTQVVQQAEPLAIEEEFVGSPTPVPTLGEPRQTLEAAVQAAAIREAEQESFESQPKPKRMIQAAATGLRNAPGIIGAAVRHLPADDSFKIVEALIESGDIELTRGERGFELGAYIIPPIAEVLMTKQVALAIAPKLTGNAAKVANIIGRSGAQTRAAGALTGTLEGIPTDLSQSIENGNFSDIGLGTGIGAIMGFLLPGSGAISGDLAEAIAKDADGTIDVLAELVEQAAKAGEDITPLRSQLDVALARAYDEGNTDVVRVMDETLDRLPTAVEIAEQRAREIGEPEVTDETARAVRGIPDPDGEQVVGARPDFSETRETAPLPLVSRSGSEPTRAARDALDLPDVREVGNRRADDSVPLRTIPEGTVQPLPVRPRDPDTQASREIDRLFEPPEPGTRLVAPTGEVGFPEPHRFTSRRVGVGEDGEELVEQNFKEANKKVKDLLAQGRTREAVEALAEARRQLDPPTLNPQRVEARVAAEGTAASDRERRIMQLETLKSATEPGSSEFRGLESDIQALMKQRGTDISAHPSTVIARAAAEGPQAKEAVEKIGEEAAEQLELRFSLSAEAFLDGVNPTLKRAVVGPALGGAIVGGTSMNDEDRAGRTALGATLGLMVAFTPGAIRKLDEHDAFRTMTTPGGVFAGKVKGMNRSLHGFVQDALGRLRGEAGEADRVIQQSMADIGDAVKKLYKKSGRSAVILHGDNPFDHIPDDVIVNIRRFIDGDRAALATIPEELRRPINNMRLKIDQYSRMFVDEGVVQGELKATFDARLGVHLTRSYRVFDDPKWVRDAPELLGEPEWTRIKNDFYKWYRSAVDPSTSDDEMVRIMAEFLDVGGADSPMRFIKSGKLGHTNANVLARRKEVPLEIRQLWGEHTDPSIQFARTITNQAFYMANHRFLKRLAELPVEDGASPIFWKPLYENGDLSTHTVEWLEKNGGRITNLADKPPTFTHTMTAKSGALKGYQTTPELAKALEEQFAGTQRIDNKFIQALLILSTASKVSKTILSQVTQVRNVTGNAAFAAAQGYHLDLLQDPIHAGKGTVRTLRTMLEGAGLWDDSGLRVNYNKLVRLGVLDDSARAEELGEALARSTKRTIEEVLDRPILRNATDLTRFVKNAAFGAYRAEDDVWKVIAFSVERGRYAKALGSDVTEEALDEMAAKIVRNTWPTFSMTPDVINQARRVGGFISFPAEVMRSMHGTFKLIEQERDNPKLRHIAHKRIAGMLTGGLTGTFGVGLAFRKIFNVSQAQEDAVREFQQPWSENSQFVHTQQIEDGKFRVIDLSYTDPFSYFQTPLTALLRGESWQEAARAVGRELVAPWLTASPIASEVYDAITNMDETEHKGRLLTKALVDGLMPGIIDQWLRATTGRSKSLREVNKLGELGALATGIRGDARDIRESLGIEFSQFNMRMGRAGSKLKRAEARGGVADRFATEGGLKRLQDDTIETKISILEDMARKAYAAVVLKMDSREVDAMMKDKKISEENREFIWTLVKKGI